MAKFWAVFLALNCNVIYIFTKAEDYDNFQYPTYLMFLIGMFALLWDDFVYPDNFRQLNSCCEFLIEFVVETFLMGFILINFLMPFEKAFVEFVPCIIGETIQSLMSTYGLDIGPVNDLCEQLKTDDAKMAASYGLGAIFLISILHANGVIDFRILESDGPGAFISDASDRAQRFYQEHFRSSFVENIDTDTVDRRYNVRRRRRHNRTRRNVVIINLTRNLN